MSFTAYSPPDKVFDDEELRVRLELYNRGAEDMMGSTNKIYLSGFGMVNATMFFTRKENEVVDYLKKLRAQQIMIQKDPRACATAVSSGEASMN